MYGEGLELYEANIPPLLRLFHIRKISPSGWVAIPLSKVMKQHTFKQTTCDYEYHINYKNLIPLPDKETTVPYKICSFDIEASSSHGDFPLAKKSYKKLAQNIVDYWKTQSQTQTQTQTQTDKTEDSQKNIVKDILLTAFGHKDQSVMDEIDIIYPKYPFPVDMLLHRWERLMELDIPSRFRD